MTRLPVLLQIVHCASGRKRLDQQPTVKRCSLMGRMFEFIDQRDRIVLHRNTAFALVILQEIARAQTELAGVFTRLKEGGRRAR